MYHISINNRVFTQVVQANPKAGFKSENLFETKLLT